MGYKITWFDKHGCQVNIYENFEQDIPSIKQLLPRFKDCGMRVYSNKSLKYIIQKLEDDDCMRISVYDEHKSSSLFDKALDYIAPIKLNLQMAIILYRGELESCCYNDDVRANLAYKNNNLHGQQILTVNGITYVIEYKHGRMVGEVHGYTGGLLSYGTRLISYGNFFFAINELKIVDEEIRNSLK